MTLPSPILCSITWENLRPLGGVRQQERALDTLRRKGEGFRVVEISDDLSAFQSSECCSVLFRSNHRTIGHFSRGQLLGQLAADSARCPRNQNGWRLCGCHGRVSGHLRFEGGARATEDSEVRYRKVKVSCK